MSQLENEIRKVKKLNTSLVLERKIFRSEMDLAIKDYQRHSQLFDDGIISQMELEKLEISKTSDGETV